MSWIKQKDIVMKRFLILLGAFFFISTTASTAGEARDAQMIARPPAVACPMLAKLCPDGSSVSPQGPNCEFPPCPGGDGGQMRVAPPGATVCTMDAKKCPDGSWVSRGGPNCEFASCPGEKSDDGLEEGEDHGDDGASSGSGEAGEGEAAPPIYVTPDGGQPPAIAPYMPQDPQPETGDESRVILDQWLKNISGADSGQVRALSGGALVATFPDIHFYTLHFRMYPIARVVPEPLKSANIFAVTSNGGGTVMHITDESQLRTLYKYSLSPLPDESTQREALKAWLTLVGELQQDSFFHFSDSDESVTVSQTADGREIAGKIQAVQGGKGQIEAKMRFDSAGNFATVETKVELLPGIRPICQATKLLDNDPVVRRMAEQDILVMGRDGEAYLRERRTKANPALRLAIDGIWARIIREGR
jgi:hypothetical protein